MSELKIKAVHSGIHAEMPFEIHVRKGMDGEKIWTFYVFLHEAKIRDFESLWLPPQVKESLWLPPQTRGAWVAYDYTDTWVNRVEGWNGGVTYYRKHGEVPGHRCVEFGCDFQHSWDQGNDYTLSDITLECIATINAIAERNAA